MFRALREFKSGMMKVQMKNQSQTRLLVDQARAGDDQAFARLFEESRRPLEAAIISYVDPSLRQKLDCEELLQQTFVSALQSMDHFEWRGDGSFVAWLSGIARNVVRKTLRKKQPGQTLEVVQNRSTGEASPSRILRRDERFDRLETAFQRLNEDHREVLTLARIDGLPIDEISKRMKRSPDAVRHLLFRALKQLRKSFGDTESLHLPDRRLEAEGGSDGE